MPGPVSDSYDPEWGTSSAGGEIKEALSQVYDRISEVIAEGVAPMPSNPIFIVDLVRVELPKRIEDTLTEKQWRLVRFALERAMESI